MTGSERVQAMRERRESGGWKQINVWLEPNAVNCLKRMQERSQDIGKKATTNDIINDALMRHFNEREAKCSSK